MKNARATTPAWPMRSSARRVWRWSEIGAIPLLAALPFMYYPKVLAGDTQPWVLLAALIALFTFRTQRFARLSDGLPVILSILCAVVFALRSELGSELLRATYTQLAFIVFWLVCRRGDDELFSVGVRLTIVVWLGVGLYQYFAVALGWPVVFSGRYMEGRGGVPSLTSEPSTYGSLSMLQMMYLLGRDERRNRPYIIGAATSVVLSGSVLALLLFVFPLLKLKARMRALALACIPLLVMADYFFTSAGLTSRLMAIGSEGGELAGLLLDPSLNLRSGHIYFTLYENLADELLLQSQIDFMNQYNAYAQAGGVLIDTESNFILPAAGELIYGAGPFGLMLLLTVLYHAQKVCVSTSARVEKVVFILVCMLNPISLSNFFLILYINRRN